MFLQRGHDDRAEGLGVGVILDPHDFDGQSRLAGAVDAAHVGPRREDRGDVNVAQTAIGDAVDEILQVAARAGEQDAEGQRGARSRR